MFEILNIRFEVQILWNILEGSRNSYNVLPLCVCSLDFRAFSYMSLLVVRDAWRAEFTRTSRKYSAEQATCKTSLP